MLLLSEKVWGCFSLDISVVETSANIFKTNSRLVILSRKLSFLSPLNFLYNFTDFHDHALVISSVRIANSKPSFMPRSFHSSVSSLRTSIVLSLWFIHSLEYPPSANTFA